MNYKEYKKWRVTGLSPGNNKIISNIIYVLLKYAISFINLINVFDNLKVIPNHSSLFIVGLSNTILCKCLLFDSNENKTIE